MITALTFILFLSSIEPNVTYPDHQIELITMGPGDLIFERYGHAALCIVNKRSAIKSKCFNYGTTNFFLPPHIMTWTFLRSKMKFWVSVNSYHQMIKLYRRLDRTIWRQVLPLTKEQMVKAVSKLSFDAKKENKYYLYHHFKDNCATRLRDIIDIATDHKLSKDKEILSGSSFRSLGRPWLSGFPPVQIASDLFLGRLIDYEINHYETQYLPDLLRERVKDRIGVKPELVYKRKGSDYKTNNPTLFILYIILGLSICLPLIFTHIINKFKKTGSVISFSILGLFGLVFWTISILSTVPELRYNETLLVFVPFDFILPFLKLKVRQKYANYRLIELLIVSVLLATGLFKQIVLLPLLIIPAACMFIIKKQKI